METTVAEIECACYRRKLPNQTPISAQEPYQRASHHPDCPAYVAFDRTAWAARIAAEDAKYGPPPAEWSEAHSMTDLNTAQRAEAGDLPTLEGGLVSHGMRASYRHIDD